VLHDGTTAEKLVIAKGTTISIPLGAINRSKALWGEDAQEFSPERWLKPVPERALEIASYRHLMTFSDGPKVYVSAYNSVGISLLTSSSCLGRSFAVTNIKALLSILIKRYSFELPNGPETKIGWKPMLVVRPTIEGEEGFAMRIRVRKVD
jgi:cytochrome P450